MMLPAQIGDVTDEVEQGEGCQSTRERVMDGMSKIRRETVRLSHHHRSSDGEHEINRLTQERADRVREDVASGSAPGGSDGRD